MSYFSSKKTILQFIFSLFPIEFVEIKYLASYTEGGNSTVRRFYSKSQKKLKQ